LPVFWSKHLAMTPPLYISLQFAFITAALYVLLLIGIHRGFRNDPRQKKAVLLVGIGVALWLGLLALLAEMNFFATWTPPRIPPFLIIPFAAMIWWSRKPSFKKVVSNIPPSALVYAQSFRIYVEIVLWLLLVESVLPVQMTFEGYNFDVLVGITALVMGYLVQKKLVSNRVLLWWNIGGIILVSTIVTIAILSFPGATRLFMNEPANTVVSYMPFIWLPAFVVPMAYFLHLASIVQLQQDKTG